MNSPSALLILQALLARFEDLGEGFIARDDLGHAGFDGGEVGFGEGNLAIDVSREAAVGGGAVAELGLGEGARGWRWP